MRVKHVIGCRCCAPPPACNLCFTVLVCSTGFNKSNATVSVTGFGSVATDATGKACFNVGAAGSYHWTASYPGAVTQSGTAVVSTCPGTTNVTVTLVPDAQHSCVGGCCDGPLPHTIVVVDINGSHTADDGGGATPGLWKVCYPVTTSNGQTPVLNDPFPGATSCNPVTATGYVNHTIQCQGQNPDGSVVLNCVSIWGGGCNTGHARDAAGTPFSTLGGAHQELIQRMRDDSCASRSTGGGSTGFGGTVNGCKAGASGTLTGGVPAGIPDYIGPTLGITFN
jgi:hypothetical protein